MTNWLLLHGTPLTPAVWDGVIASLARPGDVVVAPAVVPGPESPTGTHRALARRLAVAAAGTRRSWHVVGHSFGGQVALEIALCNPGVVASLTLLCTRDTPYPPFAEVAADVLTGRVGIGGSLSRWFSPAELAADGAVVRYARDALAGADRGAWARALTAIAVFDVSAVSRAITCPVKVVAAGHDRVSDPLTVADMAARFARSDVITLDDAFHMSVFTDPARLATLIRTAHK